MGKAGRDMAEIKEGKQISSTWAFIIYAILLSGGFVFATFFPAPYEIFAWALTAGAGAYWGKRLLQKSSKYGACGSTTVDPQQPIGD